MFCDMKVLQEIKNQIDLDLATIEYNASVYDEISGYLLGNNCIQGANLVKKAKQKMDVYVDGIKLDLNEIEKICDVIPVIIKRLDTEKENIPSMMVINNREVFISYFEDRYSFIYLIGFDDFKKLYKYGIIEVDINKGKLSKLNSKIGLSDDSNLAKYLDFKIYFRDLVNKFNYAENIEDLNYLRDSINGQLSKIFKTKSLREYLVDKSKYINELVGISGVQIMQDLYKAYDINRIRIKLILNGYSINDSRLIELVRAELSCRTMKDILNDFSEMENESIGDIYTKALKEENEKVKFLMKELNINFSQLKIIINKVN